MSHLRLDHPIVVRELLRTRYGARPPCSHSLSPAWSDGRSRVEGLGTSG